VAVHRLRRRYRELLLDEIPRSAGSPDKVEDEVRSRFDACQGERHADSCNLFPPPLL
jgi:hypothetical protein